LRSYDRNASTIARPEKPTRNQLHRIIAIQQTPQADEFKRKLRASLERETLNSRAINVARQTNVYATGDQDDTIYFIESGQIKLLMLSSEGKECLLAIHSDGDIFGELSLSGIGARSETATAMKTTTLKQIAGEQFFSCLKRDSLFEVLCAIWRCGSPISSR